MGNPEKNAEVDMADGTEDPPLGSWLAEAALDRWGMLDRGRNKRTRHLDKGTRAQTD
jgi:hypothetical protein